MSQSIRQKPEKPSPDFPLTAHPTGRWCKKIRGKLHYFGPWEEPEKALAEYQKQAEALHAGRTPRVETDGYTVCDLCNHFYDGKNEKLRRGELSPLTLLDYERTCVRMQKVFGQQRLVEDLGPDDFAKYLKELSTWRAITRWNEINRVRIVFKWGMEAAKYDRLPRYGPDFVKPSKKVLRLQRAEKGERMFEAAELRRIIKAAGQPLRAMVLLGINCGLGNADVGRLPLSKLDLKGGWHRYHRDKTAEPRRCPLWPETIKAIKDAIRKRPAPRDESLADRVFLTNKGASWYKEDVTDNPVSKEMAALLKKLGINGHRGFYALRHTFQTVGDESGDFLAVRRIMGHSSGDIADHYRERISDERLRAVTDHVRAWLFGKK
jgi:integrase